MRLSNITYSWREPFTNHEIHQLHAADEDLASFYIDACGFLPTRGGLMELT